MGRFSVFLKSDNSFIGWCGLRLHPEGQVDLGCRLAQKYWDKGYAMESSKAFLDYGFTILRLENIDAYSRKKNQNSINVLQKLGMRYFADVMDKGEACVHYTMDREGYEAMKNP